ncbi:MAG: Glycosyl transferase group 1 [Parcubacteria group bacterium GW2011_GWA2_42_11]|nr:MAG: Glycosyl transferase group 1 [Parcubacteria group bacterium GW2011_GWA2_42_11]
MSRQNKLKIAIVSFDWKNIFENDFSSFLGKLKRDRLNPQENDFFIISWGSESYYKNIDNFQTTHLKAIFGHYRFFYDFLSIFLAPLILKKHKFKPDVFLIYDFPLAAAGWLPKILWQTKIILFLGNLPSSLAWTRKKIIWRRLYQRGCEILFKNIIDSFFVISRVTGNYVLKVGVEKQKIKTIAPDILERDQEYISKSNKGMVRQKYGIPADKKIWLSVGRLEPEKDFADLINLFNAISWDDSVLIIAGKGILKDELETQVKDLGLEKKVILAGNVSRQEIWNYYQDADLFVLLSLSEGLGIVFLEAMFCGVPVLGRRIEGIEESIGASEERGFLWQTSDGLERLKEKINLCFEGGPEIEEKIKKARQYAKALGENKEDINYYFKEVLEK